MTKNKIVSSLILSFFFLTLSFVFASSSLASRLYLDPTSINTQKDNEFEVKIGIDTEGTKVFGTDTSIRFMNDDLELREVKNGGFFSDFYYSSSTGTIEVHSFFSALFDSKTGSGNVAIIKFKSKKDSGSSIISFICGETLSTQLLDSNGNNILTCGSLNQSSVNFSTSSTSTPTPTATGEPNGCGGTCGSDINCKSGFYCYQGFCRNPACSGSSSCVCPTATNKATPKSKASSTKTPEPTVQVVTLTDYTEQPSPTPQEVSIEEEQTPSRLKNLLLAASISLGLLSIVYLIYKLFKNKKNKPPKDSNLNQENPISPQMPINQNPTGYTSPVQEPPVQNPPSF